MRNWCWKILQHCAVEGWWVGEEVRGLWSWGCWGWQWIVRPVVVIEICVVVLENPWSSNFKHSGTLLVWLFLVLSDPEKNMVLKRLLSKPCLKHTCHSYFYDNFGKRYQFSYFFHCYVQKGSAEKVGIKTTTSPQVCCCTTLWNVRITAALFWDTG